MAPPSSALAVANDLKRALLDCGVPQVSIELQIGRSGRWVSTGSRGGTSFVANLGHHIASRPSASNPTPGLSVVKNGRPGLSGPLCNGYGGMDLIARIICLDWANHPGEGGPWTIDGVRIPRDGGRPYLFGWEHEGGFSTSVWDATYTNRATGWRMTYREFMGRCHAGTLKFLGRPRTSHGEHSTWADLKQIGRKIDRLGYGHPVGTPATKGINELTPYYLNARDDDMAGPADWTSEDWKVYENRYNGLLVRYTQFNIAWWIRHFGALLGDPITSPVNGADRTPRQTWQDAVKYAHEAAQARPLLVAIAASLEGFDTQAILGRIDEIAAQDAQRFESLSSALEQAGVERAELAVLVRAAQSGELAVDELLQRLGEKLLAPEGDPQ